MSAAANKAVFLSYASQDAAAAKRICDALRGAGVEVWFDADGGLEHGDEWDAKIRRQIKECVLFLAVISANTQAREEGYFRIEWELAAQRALGIASGVAFILPVVIDDTKEPGALVPDRFRAVQWTRLKDGVVPPDVLQRFLKLWSHRTGTLKQASVEREARSAASVAEKTNAGEPSRQPKRALWAWVALGFVALGAAYFIFTPPFGPKGIVRGGPGATQPIAAVIPPVSEARQLVAKAYTLIRGLDATREDYALAEEYCQRAMKLDSDDGEVWAAYAQLNSAFGYRGWDTSPARREQTRIMAERAIRLTPQSAEARMAQASAWSTFGINRDEREKLLREIVRDAPDNQGALRFLAVTVLAKPNGLEECLAINERSAALPGGDPLALFNNARYLWTNGQPAKGYEVLQRALAQRTFTSGLVLKMAMEITWRGDLAAAEATLGQIPQSALQEDRANYHAGLLRYSQGNAAAALETWQSFPRDYYVDFVYEGPKGLLLGLADELDHRDAAAKVEWRAALQLVEKKIAAAPSKPAPYYSQAYLLACLGEKAAASDALRTYEQLAGIKYTFEQPMLIPMAKVYARLGRFDEIFAHPPGGSRTILRISPDFEALRADPRFQSLLAPAAKIEDRGQKTEAILPVDQKSVAVLAFANLSEDKGNEYFSEGISEELLNVLAKIPGLKVSARTSAFYFKGKEVPIPEIARQLGVAYVVEGSVRKAGDKVRITAQLIKADGGFHVWSDTFTRDLKDIFAVQDEIAGLIAQNLKLGMGLASPVAHRAVNPEAHQLLLEGRHFWNLRTMEGFDRAEAAFSKAIKLDPDFAQAHAGLADVRWVRTVFNTYAGINYVPANYSGADAKRALALDPTLAEAYPAAAAALHWAGRAAEAEQLFLKAIALNPNYALAHHWYSLVLEAQGRLDEALAQIDQAIQLDPLSVAALSTRFRYLFSAGRLAEALPTYENKVLALRQDYFFSTGEHAQALLASGRREEALAVARSICARESMEVRYVGDGLAVYVMRALGHEAEAAAHIERLLPRLPADSYLRGVALASLDRLDEAMPFLERTPPGLTEIFYWNPAWDRWRDDPRFVRLMAKVNCTEEYKVARATLARMQQAQAAKK